MIFADVWYFRIRIDTYCCVHHSAIECGLDAVAIYQVFVGIIILSGDDLIIVQFSRDEMYMSAIICGHF